MLTVFGGEAVYRAYAGADTAVRAGAVLTKTGCVTLPLGKDAVICVVAFAATASVCP